jgi:hypothetical protein
MHKTCELARGEADPCGRDAFAEVRFGDAPEKWFPACEGCINDRRGNEPLIVILEVRDLPCCENPDCFNLNEGRPEPVTLSADGSCPKCGKKN